MRTAQEWYAKLIAADKFVGSPARADVMQRVDWEERIAKYCLAQQLDLAELLALPEVTPLTGEIPHLDDMRNVTAPVVRNIYFGTPIFHFHPAIVSPARTKCPRCKRPFVLGERIKRTGQTWLYHVDCGSAHIAERAIEEQKPKQKSAWLRHQGRVIKKGDGL